MARENYEERRAARIERLRARAEKLRHESDAHAEFANKLQRLIPLGQPVLIGHHSERRHRRHLDKIDRGWRKAAETGREAKALDRRADAAEKNPMISSDDPSAADKIRLKIAELQKMQDAMVAINKIVRKHVKAKTHDAGVQEIVEKHNFPEAAARRLFEHDRLHGFGFPDYKTKNNGANIRRLEQRLATLERKAKDVSKEWMYGEVRVFDNVDFNRLQLFFPKKPDAVERQLLKKQGFRWSPTEGAWQRHRGYNAQWGAEHVLRTMGLTLTAGPTVVDGRDDGDPMDPMKDSDYATGSGQYREEEAADAGE